VACLFQDALGRLVRSKQVKAGEAWEKIGAWSDGCLVEMYQWEMNSERSI